MDFVGCFNDNTFLTQDVFYYHHAVFNHLAWASPLNNLSEKADPRLSIDVLGKSSERSISEVFYG